MNTLRTIPFVALLLSGATSLVCAQTAAPSGPPLSANDAAHRATAACEKSVSDTVRMIREQRQMEVQFVGGQRALATTQTDETGVKGEGRYRAPGGRLTPFTYTCTFNAKTGETSGVMFKEKGVTPSASTAPAWQPDLNKISPEACETAVASAVKNKYPRVDRIALDAASRQLAAGSEGRTQLRGQGAVIRAPGMNAAPISYRCEFDGRSGKLVDTYIQD